MDQDCSKKAAKAFVDKYFPMKQPNSKLSDVLSDLFPLSPQQQEPGKKQGYEGNSSWNSAKTVAADSYSQVKASKSHGAPQRSGNAVVFCEVSEPCSMSSSVDYGCRDNYYPNTPAANRQPGSSYEKDKKDGYYYPDPEHSRGEWWQGTTLKTSVLHLDRKKVLSGEFEEDVSCRVVIQQEVEEWSTCGFVTKEEEESLLQAVLFYPVQLCVG